MRLIDKIKIVLFQPDSFFARLKKENSLKPAFIYFLILSFFSATMTGLFFPVHRLLLVKLGMPASTSLFETSFIFSLMNFLLSIPFSFVAAAVFFVWIMLFGGRQPYTKAYQLLVYSATPTNIFSWIPIIGFFSLFWYLVLLIKGTKQVYSFSTTRSIMVYVSLLILFLILMILLITVVRIYLPILRTSLNQ